jgi:hypothetical protein
MSQQLGDGREKEHCSASPCLQLAGSDSKSGSSGANLQSAAPDSAATPYRYPLTEL